MKPLQGEARDKPDYQWRAETEMTSLPYLTFTNQRETAGDDPFLGKSQFWEEKYFLWQVSDPGNKGTYRCASCWRHMEYMRSLAHTSAWHWRKVQNIPAVPEDSEENPQMCNCLQISLHFLQERHTLVWTGWNKASEEEKCTHWPAWYRRRGHSYSVQALTQSHDM